MRKWVGAGFAGIAVGIIFAAIAIVIIIYSGAYNVAGDEPHTNFVFWAAQTTRDRSIERHSSGITVTADLNDPKRVSAGAGLYGEMCSGCHLAPGMEKTEISQGLYPRAPELFRGSDLTPAEEFWVIKHGIKMTGMAAWGPTHNDTLIWDMVAFLRKLPSLSASQYQAAVKSAPEDHDEMMRDMPGMKSDKGDGH